MQSLEAACEEGGRTFKKAKTSRTPLPLQPGQDAAPPPTDVANVARPKPPFCIHTKLLELYLEEWARDPNPKQMGIKRNSHLLEKLVARERLNTLVLNLYPGNKGYSLSFPTAPNVGDDAVDAVESKTWPYEDEELLQYIGNEELPAFFVDLLEPHYGFLFYSGCIIAEVRDYRQAFPACKCDIHHVLLKPTLQSILADINGIADEKEDWGTEEKLQLESQILLAQNPRLCLDPRSSLSATTSRINHNRQLLNTHRLRRAARKYSQSSVNKKKKLIPHTHRPGLELYDHLTRLRARSKSKLPKKAHEEIRPVPVPNLEPPPLNPPAQGVHIKEFKAYPPQRNTADCLPQLVEEYVLETDMQSKEKDKRRVYHIKLSILQRPSNGEYLGELYLDTDHKKGEKNGVACRFSLGTRVHANRYIQQFTEMFTDGGPKLVRINYGLKERAAQVQTVQQAQLQLNAHGKPSQQDTNQENKIKAIANNLKQQFQEENAKHQQQKLSSSSNNAALINLLNSSPASNINSDASAALVNAINNSSLLPQQVQTINQKLLSRKITVSNLLNARVLNQSNLIAVSNNNRLSLSELSSQLGQQQQQITLTTVSGAGFTPASYTTVPVKQQPNQTTRIINDGKSALSALLVGVPAADRPDIVGTNTNSLLLEKLGGGASPAAPTPSPTHFIHSPKMSPLSSPPPQNSAAAASTTGTISLQNLNFAPGLSGLQNVQVWPGFSQPISVSLNVSSTGTLQGHPTGLLVSVPVASSSAAATTTTSGQQAAVNVSVAPTVVLANAATSNIAQLVSSGVKGLSQQGIRTTAGPTGGVTLAQGGQPFQLITPLQRPRMQQSTVGQNITARSIQRTPITIKMAAATTTPQTNNSQASQKQAQQANVLQRRSMPNIYEPQ